MASSHLSFPAPSREGWRNQAVSCFWCRIIHRLHWPTWAAIAREGIPVLQTLLRMDLRVLRPIMAFASYYRLFQKPSFCERNKLISLMQARGDPIHRHSAAAFPGHGGLAALARWKRLHQIYNISQAGNGVIALLGTSPPSLCWDVDLAIATWMELSSSCHDVYSSPRFVSHQNAPHPWNNGCPCQSIISLTNRASVHSTSQHQASYFPCGPSPFSTSLFVPHHGLCAPSFHVLSFLERPILCVWQIQVAIRGRPHLCSHLGLSAPWLGQ